MSESNCRGWAIVSSAKKAVSTISSPPFIHTRFQPGGPDDFILLAEPFQRFSSRDTDKPLKRLEEIQCERRGHPIETG